MQHTYQLYLNLYSNLQNPTQSKKANQQLLKLQASNQSWEIAYQLIHIEQHYIHGCQLLSKKLNTPLPMNIIVEDLLRFLLAQNRKTDLLYCCIAKALMHLGRFTIPHQFQSEEVYLRIFKQFCVVVGGVRTATGIDLKHLKETFYEHLKPTIISLFHTNTQLILECIDSYIISHGKIKSTQIVQLLLTQPISSISGIMEEVFLSQSYPQLNNQFWQYLQQQATMDENYFSIFIAYARSLNLSEINCIFLAQLLNKIVNYMKIDNEQTHHYFITDTFEFWFKLVSQFRNNNSDTKYIIEEAIVEVWKIVLFSSKLSEIPNHVSAKQIVELDNDQYNFTQEISQNKFRITAQDFITLCLDIGNLSTIQKMYIILNHYANSQNPIDIELSIFILSNIIELNRQGQTSYQLGVFSTLLEKQYLFNHYLCERMIVLMGKLQSLIDNNLQLVQPILAFLKTALQYQQLQFTASQNLTQILLNINNSQHIANIQPYLDTIFTQTYNNSKVMENLTNALLIFILKFKNNMQQVRVFLNSFQTLIQKQPTNKAKCQYIEYLLNSTLSAQAYNFQNFQRYLQSLNQLIILHRQDLLNNCYQSTRKPQLTNAVRIINISVKLLIQYQTQLWLELMTLMMQRMLTITDQVYAVMLTPFITALNSTASNNNQIYQYLLNLLQIVEKPITQYTTSLKTIDYLMVKYTLQLHQIIIKKFINNTFTSYKQYNPSTIFKYVCQRILDNQNSTQFQILREALGLFTLLVNNNYQLPILLEYTLRSYPRTQNILWKFLQSIIIECYKKGGKQILTTVFKNIKPELLPPHPLWNSLEISLQTSDLRSLKNWLLCLK